MSSNKSNNNNSNSEQQQTSAAVGSSGGVAWAGSLVGSQNPQAPTGYRYSTPSKRYRIVQNGDEDAAQQQQQLPNNLQVQFCNRQGQELSDTVLDLPLDSTTDDLTALVHQLISLNSGANAKEDDHKKVPYSFYATIGDSESELTTSLKDLLVQNIAKISTETVLTLTYQPLAVFRVRPVTRCTDTLPGHTEAVLHVSYAPHGQLLASGGGDTVVRFWDVHTGTTKFVCRGVHQDHVLGTAWSPDGRRFASADKRGVLVVWDPATGKVVGKPIRAHSKWITALAWEPLHLCPTSASSKSSNENSSNNTQTVGGCERLATASKDGTIKVWNTRTGRTALPSTLSGHTDSVESLKWSGEGLLYSASRDRTIKVWDATTRGILVRTLTGHGHRVNTLALSSEAVLRAGPFDYQNAASLYSGSSKNNMDDMIAAAREKYQAFRQHHGEDRLVSGSDDFTLYLWHPESSKHPVKRLTGHQQAVNDRELCLLLRCVYLCELRSNFPSLFPHQWPFRRTDATLPRPRLTKRSRCGTAPRAILSRR